MNVYVGNGHKYEEVSYLPVHPPIVNEDPDEYEIQDEPNPKDEPVPEKKEGEEGEEGGEVKEEEEGEG